MKKLEFISHLLEHKKLNNFQKERFFKLVANELSSIEKVDEKVLKDIELIKKKIGLETKTLIDQTDPSNEIKISLSNDVKPFSLSLDNQDKKRTPFRKMLDEFENDTKLNENIDKELSTEKISKTVTIEGFKKVSVPNIKYLSPVKTYQFLFNFNQNPTLKSVCHEIDSNELITIIKYCETEVYDFNSHLDKILEVYDEYEKNNFAPPKIKALIRGYLTGKDYKNKPLKYGWSTDRITFNWSKPELKNWCNENKAFPPCPDSGLIEENENIGFEFSEPIKSKTFNTYIKTFSDLVIHFKHLFHIRQDNSLKNILKTQNELNNWNQLIDFEIHDEDFPTNIELFTDVDKIVQAYKIIIELIINKRLEEKQTVKLSFCQKNNNVELSIHHLTAIYRKSLSDTIERPLGQTYTGLIENQLNGLCNFYVRADFGQQQFAEINIWNGKPRKATPLELFTGVEHIFEFLKK